MPTVSLAGRFDTNKAERIRNSGFDLDTKREKLSTKFTINASRFFSKSHKKVVFTFFDTKLILRRSFCFIRLRASAAFCSDNKNLCVNLYSVILIIRWKLLAHLASFCV